MAARLARFHGLALPCFDGSLMSVFAIHEERLLAWFGIHEISTQEPRALHFLLLSLSPASAHIQNWFLLHSKPTRSTFEAAARMLREFFDGERGEWRRLAARYRLLKIGRNEEEGYKSVEDVLNEFLSECTTAGLRSEHDMRSASAQCFQQSQLPLFSATSTFSTAVTTAFDWEYHQLRSPQRSPSTESKKMPPPPLPHPANAPRTRHMGLPPPLSPAQSLRDHRRSHTFPTFPPTSDQVDEGYFPPSLEASTQLRVVEPGRTGEMRRSHISSEIFSAFSSRTASPMDRSTPRNDLVNGAISHRNSYTDPEPPRSPVDHPHPHQHWRTRSHPRPQSTYDYGHSTPPPIHIISRPQNLRSESLRPPQFRRHSESSNRSFAAFAEEGGEVRNFSYPNTMRRSGSPTTILDEILGTLPGRIFDEVDQPVINSRSIEGVEEGLVGEKLSTTSRKLVRKSIRKKSHDLDAGSSSSPNTSHDTSHSTASHSRSRSLGFIGKIFGITSLGSREKEQQQYSSHGRKDEAGEKGAMSAPTLLPYEFGKLGRI